MSRFAFLTPGSVLLMDGAMGTELRRRAAGAAPGPLWNLARPTLVQAVHRDYLAAGARVLLTNTFQSNPITLAAEGLEDSLDGINQAAVAHARSAPGVPRFVLGDVGPILSPGRYEEFADRAALAR